MAFVPRQSQRVAYVSGVLLFLSAILTAYSVRHPAIGAHTAAWVLRATGPVQEIHASLFGAIHGLVNNYRELSNATTINQQLKEQLAVLRAQTVRLHEFREENDRLRALLNMADVTEQEGPIARVIGMSFSGWADLITINAGSDQGVKVGDPILSGEGVVGRVIAVSPRSAQVLPIVDPSSSVDALFQESRVRGVLEGSERGGCMLRYVESRETVSIGDVVVTSGFDGVFPPGLLLGRVTAIQDRNHELFRSITVEPSVDMSRLEQVMVVTNTHHRGVEQDSARSKP